MKSEYGTDSVDFGGTGKITNAPSAEIRFRDGHVITIKFALLQIFNSVPSMIIARGGVFFLEPLF